MKSCTSYLNEDGEKLDLHDDIKSSLNGTINDYAKLSLRTIAIAYKDLIPGEGGPRHAEMDIEHTELAVVEVNGFTLIGILGIRDIIRPEVPDAVMKC